MYVCVCMCGGRGMSLYVLLFFGGVSVESARYMTDWGWHLLPKKYHA